MRSRFVVTVDGARARIFAVEFDDQQSWLAEVDDLVNLQHKIRDSDLFADSRPGLRRELASGPRHGLDDGREDSDAEADRRFASLIVDSLAQRAPSGGLRVVLAAGPEMLGHLRVALARGVPGVEIIEYPKQLTALPAHALQQRLADVGLVPPRVRASD